MTITVAVLILATNTLVFLFQQNSINSKDGQIKELNARVNELENDLDTTKSELDSTKSQLSQLLSPPMPPYCEDGEVYENLAHKYKVCVPGGWAKDSRNTEVVIVKQIGSEKNVITITMSTKSIEDALKKYTSDVYVDDTNRDYNVDGVDAIQVSGTVPPDLKRAITVFTKNATTFEIFLENNDDATYTENLKQYKEFVESFKFLD